MIVGFKHYKNRNIDDDKDIQWYNSASIDHINEKGDRVVLRLGELSDDRESTKAIITYNNKFESAVIKINSPVKNVTKNVHRILAITLSNELFPSLVDQGTMKTSEQILEEMKEFNKAASIALDHMNNNNNNNMIVDLTYQDDTCYTFYYSHNGKVLKVSDGIIVENTLETQEDRNRADDTCYRHLRKHLWELDAPLGRKIPKPLDFSDNHFNVTENKSPQQIILEMKKMNKHFYNDNNVAVPQILSENGEWKEPISLEQILDRFHDDFVNKHKEENNKTHRYPLIYKLKERQDYKETKNRFEHHKHSDVMDYVAIVYVHKDDKFYLQFHKPVITPDVTILDIYIKK